MDYTTLSLADVKTGLENVARDVQSTFGNLDARQLNWKPDATRWSVAQCLEHLLAANRLMFESSDHALRGTRPPTMWQRMPALPGLFGPMLIRSQAPTSERRYKAAPAAQPATSDIAADVIQRFVEQNRDAIQRVQSLDEGIAARTIMTSPFVKVVTYSVLDGWRLVFTHDRRHIEQARRVTQSSGFPRS